MASYNLVRKMGIQTNFQNGFIMYKIQPKLGLLVYAKLRRDGLGISHKHEMEYNIITILELIQL